VKGLGSAIRGSNARARRKNRERNATVISGAVVGVLVEERERRYARRMALLSASPEEKPRIQALIQMGPPDEAEAERLVRDFLARKQATACPTRAAEAIRNGDGFA
jgi:hypothetical protein